MEEGGEIVPKIVAVHLPAPVSESRQDDPQQPVQPVTALAILVPEVRLTGVVQIQNVPHSYKNGYYNILSLAEQWRY